MKNTPLTEEHIRAGARMIDFFGWHMPVMYSTIIDADAVVLAVPATPAARLLRDHAPVAAGLLDTVEYASTFLMSVCARPMVAANSAVAAPTTATVAMAAGAVAGADFADHPTRQVAEVLTPGAGHVHRLVAGDRDLAGHGEDRVGGKRDAEEGQLGDPHPVAALGRPEVVVGDDEPELVGLDGAELIPFHVIEGREPAENVLAFR